MLSIVHTQKVKVLQDKLGLGLVWAAVWAAIALWLLRLISGSSSGSTCRQATAGRERGSWPADLSSGRNRRRSGDLTLFRRALCQLSYPTSNFSGPDGI